MKLYGPELEVLRSKGAEIEAIARNIPGLTDVFLEKQVPIPQIKILVNRDRAKVYGLQAGALNRQLSTLFGGRPSPNSARASAPSTSSSVCPRPIATPRKNSATS